MVDYNMFYVLQVLYIKERSVFLCVFPLPLCCLDAKVIKKALKESRCVLGWFKLFIACLLLLNFLYFLQNLLFTGLLDGLVYLGSKSIGLCFRILRQSMSWRTSNGQRKGFLSMEDDQWINQSIKPLTKLHRKSIWWPKPQT